MSENAINTNWLDSNSIISDTEQIIVTIRCFYCYVGKLARVKLHIHCFSTRRYLNAIESEKACPKNSLLEGLLC